LFGLFYFFAAAMALVVAFVGKRPPTLQVIMLLAVAIVFLGSGISLFRRSMTAVFWTGMALPLVVVAMILGKPSDAMAWIWAVVYTSWAFGGFRYALSLKARGIVRTEREYTSAFERDPDP